MQQYNKFRRGFLRAASAATLVLGLPLAAAGTAQAYPTETVRIVLGFPPGGSTDNAARLIANDLAVALGQAVVVENRPGANATIAAEAVARAKNDGHTLLMTASNHSINAVLYPALRFDSVKDFDPLMAVAMTPTVLVVPPDSPHSTVQDLISSMKENPEKYTYASAGSGGAPHLAAEMFKLATDTSALHIPFKGSSPAIIDVMAGRIDMYFATLGSVQKQILAGQLRAIAVAAPERSESLPDVPTFAESGMEDFRLDAWFGLLTPAGIPSDVQKRLEEEIRAIVSGDKFKEAMSAAGFAAVTDSSPESLKQQIAHEISTFTDLVEKTGLKIE